MAEIIGLECFPDEDEGAFAPVTFFDHAVDMELQMEFA